MRPKTVGEERDSSNCTIPPVHVQQSKNVDFSPFTDDGHWLSQRQSSVIAESYIGKQISIGPNVTYSEKKKALGSQRVIHYSGTELN